VTELLENALRKVATLPREEQDAIASQILETLGDEAAWKEKLAGTQDKLQGLAREARREHAQGETRPLDEILSSNRGSRARSAPPLLRCPMRFRPGRGGLTTFSRTTLNTPAFDSRKLETRVETRRKLGKLGDGKLGGQTGRSPSFPRLSSKG
jgi:hypothetical protein